MDEKTWFRQTQRGNIKCVRKMVREHYLRDDIGTWHENQPVPSSVVFVHSCVVLRQMDVLERVASAASIVFTQTVLASVKEETLKGYRKIREVIPKIPTWFVLANEHFRPTYIKKQKGETKADFDKRALFCVAQWYQLTFGCQTLVVCDCHTISPTGFDSKIVTTKNWILGLRGHVPNDLADMLASLAITEQPPTPDGPTSRYLFDPHLSKSTALQLVGAGKLFRGVLDMARTRAEGVVALHNVGQLRPFPDVNALTVNVLVLGEKSLNRSIHGDEVVVELLDRDQWCTKLYFDEAADDEAENQRSTTADSMVKSQVPGASDASQAVPVARVVCIVERKLWEHCGTLVCDKNDFSNFGGETAQLVVPLDIRIPKIRIRTRQLEQLSNCRLIVRIDSWARDSMYPEGHYIEKLGQVGDRDVEADMLLRQHNIVVRPFSEAAVNCLPAADFSVSQVVGNMSKGKKGKPSVVSDRCGVPRLDLRGICVCSIDPPGCVDIDDTLHARRVGNLIEVGVHIADVTAFVEEGSALDLEAASRGSTVYLVDRRIDMLPKLLGENLCSLHENVDRLTFSVIWQMDENANVIQTKFTRSVIRSRAAMTYARAQRILDNKHEETNDEVVQSVKLLGKLAELLNKRRVNNGALTLASAEVKFELDEVTKTPVSFSDSHDDGADAAHKLVEEFMLLANEYVARKILETFPRCSLLRRHPAPSTDKFDSIQRALSKHKLKLDLTSSKSLSDSLTKVEKNTNQRMGRLVRMLTTQCMQQAVYISSADLDSSQYVHYGLALSVYTHFTSPIRRYADVVVHRLLHAALAAEQANQSQPAAGAAANPFKALDQASLSALCRDLNDKYRSAQQAGRASSQLHLLMYFKDHPGKYRAHITQVRANGFQAMLLQFGIEGVVQVCDRGEAEFAWGVSEDGCALVSADGKRVFRVMDEVDVNVGIEVSAAGRLSLAMQLTA